jgi:hypothetical protein
LRAGSASQRRLGQGAELHELRDFKSGDPFRLIAWKASARTGKLIAKDLEDESQQSLHLIIDSSGGLREGRHGRRPLDWAVEWIALAARHALESGCEVGCSTVDQHILTQLTPRRGGLQVTKIYDALIDFMDVTEFAQTGVSDEGVAILVGQYLRQQAGIDFADPRDPLGWNIQGLAAYAAKDLSHLRDLRAGNAQPMGLLRKYCKQHGIPLPFAKDFPFHSNSSGLTEAIHRAAHASREPTTMIVVADVTTFSEENTLGPAIRRSLAKGHEVRCIAPLRDSQSLLGTSVVGPPTTHFIRTRSQARHAQQSREWLAKLGIPLACPMVDSMANATVTHTQYFRRRSWMRNAS